jgi:chorismate mutase
MNKEQQIQELMSFIKKLEEERDNTPKHQVQVIQSITEDINYYQNQIDYLIHEV